MSNRFSAKQRGQKGKGELACNTAQEPFIWAGIAPNTNNLNSLTFLPLEQAATIFLWNNASWVIWNRGQHCHLVTSLYQTRRSCSKACWSSTILGRVIGRDEENVGHRFLPYQLFLLPGISREAKNLP